MSEEISEFKKQYEALELQLVPIAEKFGAHIVGAVLTEMLINAAVQMAIQHPNPPEIIEDFKKVFCKRIDNLLKENLPK